MKGNKDKVYISERNFWAIHDFAYHDDYHRIFGRRLEALYRLVQRKGKVIDFPKK